MGVDPGEAGKANSSCVIRLWASIATVRPWLKEEQIRAALYHSSQEETAAE